MTEKQNLESTAKTPWDYMGAEERRILGDVVADPAEQARWCKAMVFGTLPYMWRDKASVVRELAYDKMELAPGNRVLLIGECLRVCGFVDDIRQRIGASGEIHEVDITNEARSAYLAGRRGRGGQLATWPWLYARDLADRSFDTVAVMQATQHTDDWRETAEDLLRVLKPGRPIVVAEITLSPKLKMKAELDVHIEAWIDKIFSRIGWSFDQTPYSSLDDLRRAFDGLVDAAGTFDWRGIELFWARNKRAA
ncbi:MAG TPA: methyltransferase domain-containing protein [Xanthobacteraceae bacterium]|nr:methyltransferase domain-containing protein [Xanthobacteraceae bacterium]